MEFALIKTILGLGTALVGLVCVIIVIKTRSGITFKEAWYSAVASFASAVAFLVAASLWRTAREYFGWKEKVGPWMEYPEYIYFFAAYLFFALSAVRMARTVRELRTFHRQLEALSTTDDLTGLYDRRYFFAALDKELKRAERYGAPLSLIMLDIDHFKEVNDTYGHPAGDLVLRRLAVLMRRLFRNIDILARVGGEEFVAILPSTGIDATLKVAERFRREVANQPIRMPYGPAVINITASLGVTGTSKYPASGAALFAAVDKALYQAKAEGRNRVCFNPF